MRYLLVCITVFTLTGCSLAASLTGGPRTETFTPGYELLGQEHTMTVTFTLTDDTVTELTIEPGAASTLEWAHQLALAANVRPSILGKKIGEIDIPETSGDEERLRKVLRGVIEKLREVNSE